MGRRKKEKKLSRASAFQGLRGPVRETIHKKKKIPVKLPHTFISRVQPGKPCMGMDISRDSVLELERVIMVRASGNPHC